MRDRELTRLFLRRFVENDLISPEADRVQVLSQVGGAIVTGALFVTTVFSLGYIDRPYALPAATAAQVLRVLFAWSNYRSAGARPPGWLSVRRVRAHRG